MTWFKLFYNNISSCIQNNGWSSEFFSLSRGVRQGCPLSPYLDDNNKRKWKSFVNHYLEKHGGKLFFSANLKRQDVPLYSLFQTLFLAETVEHRSGVQ